MINGVGLLYPPVIFIKNKSVRNRGWNSEKHTGPHTGGGQTLKKKAKEARIAAEKERLTTLMDGVPSSSAEVVKGLIERVSFMNVTLSELEEDINKNGSIELFKNGSQEFYKESASVKTYNTMINRYTAAVKELLRLVVENDKTKVGSPEVDEFMNFLTTRE